MSDYTATYTYACSLPMNGRGIATGEARFLAMGIVPLLFPCSQRKIVKKGKAEEAKLEKAWHICSRILV